MVKYVYPHLPSKVTTPFIRYAGSGLGNSLFVFARAAVVAEENNLELINPTWLNFDPVQWKLWARDKRLYNDIFNSVGITGLKRLKLLMFGKKVKEEDYKNDGRNGDWVEIFYMRGFDPIRTKSSMVKSCLMKCLKPQILAPVESFDFTGKIAVHIRLGDYGLASLPISYYKTLIEQVHRVKPQYTFLIFSDGKDEELKAVTALPYTKRVFFGNAMSDILAISSCQALIGSHSTFSDWGGYLGQIPCLLPKKPRYQSFLADERKESIVGKDCMVPDVFYSYL